MRARKKTDKKNKTTEDKGSDCEGKPEESLRKNRKERMGSERDLNVLKL